MASKKKATAPKVGSIQNGNFIMGAEQFQNLQGERFAGLQILKLEIGQAAGPFTCKEILRDQNLNKKKKLKKGEKPNLVDVYVADFQGSEIRMPAAASFVMKAKDSKLAVGDVFAVKRVADYPNDYGRDSQGFELTVISRK